MKPTRIIALFLFLVTSPFPASAQPKCLTILHFNDLHGHLEADNEGGGAARIATIVSDIEEENRSKGCETIVLFGGDVFTGSLISSEFEGQAEFDFFNMLGVDAMVIGNHEFDYRIPRLQEVIGKAAFPVLSANIYWKGAKERFAPATAIIRDDVDVGIVGLTAEETRVLTPPSNVADLDFSDPIKEAKKEIKQLKRDASFRIALTHLGVAGDVELAEKVKGLDAVLGGHDHVPPNEYCREVKKIPVCQTPPYGRYVGRLDFEIDGKRVKYSGSDLIPVTAETSEEGPVAKMVTGYARQIKGKYDRVIGQATMDLYTEREKPYPLGIIVAEAIRTKSGAEIAFVNSGGIRAPIKHGPIRIRDVADVLPFRNTLFSFDATGRQIEKIIEHGIRRGGGAFPQVAGLEFSVEGAGPKEITVGGGPLEQERTYRVATVNFLVAGGDGYSMLKDLPGKRNSGVLMRDALIDYIKARRSIP